MLKVGLCSSITLSTLRAGLGCLDGGENHEGKRREKEKEDILFKFGRLAWKVSQVRTVDVCKYRYEAGQVVVVALLLPAAT